MFGYSGGESSETLARKIGYRQDAHRRWDFLTRYDLSTVKNPMQLESLVRERGGTTKAEVHEAVETWMAGKTF